MSVKDQSNAQESDSNDTIEDPMDMVERWLRKLKEFFSIREIRQMWDDRYALCRVDK